MNKPKIKLCKQCDNPAEITTEYKTELYFSWWLNDLKEAGYIRDWEFQKNPFPLFDGGKYEVLKQLKTKIRIDKRTLLQPATYTADFTIHWAEKARGIFFNSWSDPIEKKPLLLAADWITYVDTKPVYELHQSKTAKFVIIQKWVYQKFGVYINSVVPEKLFKKTFTPKRFLLTDKTNKPRKINWQVISLQEFVNNFGGE